MTDWRMVREDFPPLKEVVYLDSAATSLTPLPVVEAMAQYYTRYRANVHRGAHRLSVRASDAFDSARAAVAKLIGARDPAEVLFTKNATEGLNMAAFGLRLREGDKVVTTTLEHHSNLMPWQVLHHRSRVELAFLEASEDGALDLDRAAEVIDRRTRVVTVTHASNVLGSMTPVRELARLAQDAGALLVLDAAQTAGHQPIDVQRLEADIVAASGHKGLLGPTGTGVLYVRAERMEELGQVAFGGGMVKDVEMGGFTLLPPPDRYEAGTPNVGGAIGLGAAVAYLSRIGVESVEERERALARAMLKGVSELPSVTVYGPRDAARRTPLVSFNVGGLNPHDVAIILDEMAAIAVRSGHHCAIPLSKRLGAPEGTVRASLGLYNDERDVEALLRCLGDIARRLA